MANKVIHNKNLKIVGQIIAVNSSWVQLFKLNFVQIKFELSIKLINWMLLEYKIINQKADFFLKLSKSKI